MADINTKVETDNNEEIEYVYEFDEVDEGSRSKKGTIAGFIAGGAVLGGAFLLIRKLKNRKNAKMELDDDAKPSKLRSLRKREFTCVKKEETCNSEPDEFEELTEID